MTTIVSAPTTITVASPNTGSSVLSRTAASMAPGTWTQIATNNMIPTLQTNGAVGDVFTYTDKMVWDSIGRKIYWAGSDHQFNTLTQKFVQYDDATNTWSVLPNAYWFETLSNSTARHGYHHNAIDVVRRKFYHKKATANREFQYDITTGVWSQLPVRNNQYNAIAVGVSFVPWIGSQGSLMVHQVESGTNGSLFRYDVAGGNWISPPPLDRTIRNSGDPHNILEAAPNINYAVFGGGNGASGNVHIIRPNGTFLLDATPSPNGGWGVQTTVVTHCPVSGDFLFLWGLNAWWKFNAATVTWTRMTAPAQFFNDPVYAGNPVNGIVACAVDTYGVIVFAKDLGNGSAFFWVYKHA